MRHILLSGLAAALVASCAAQPQDAGMSGQTASAAPSAVTAAPVPPPATAPPQPLTPPPGAMAPAPQPGAMVPPPPPRYGGSFLSVIGTPFLIAFKIPVCLLTVVVAAPVAGLSEISGSNAEGAEMREGLRDGLARNCGPPYSVTP